MKLFSSIVLSSFLVTSSLVSADELIYMPYKNSFMTTNSTTLEYAQVIEQLPYTESEAEELSDLWAQKAVSQFKQNAIQLNQSITQQDLERMNTDAKEKYYAQFSQHHVNNCTFVYTFAANHFAYITYNSDGEKIYHLEENDGICSVWDDTKKIFGLETQIIEFPIPDEKTRRYSTPILQWMDFYTNIPQEVKLTPIIDGERTTFTYTDNHEALRSITFTQIESKMVPVQLEKHSESYYAVTTYNDYVFRNGLLVPSLIVTEDTPSMKTLDINSSLGKSKTTFILQ